MKYKSETEQRLINEGLEVFWSKNSKTVFDKNGTAYRQRDHLNLATDLAVKEIEAFNRTAPAHKRMSINKKAIRREVRKLIKHRQCIEVEAPSREYLSRWSKFIRWIKSMMLVLWRVFCKPLNRPQ